MIVEKKEPSSGGIFVPVYPMMRARIWSKTNRTMRLAMIDQK